MIHFYAQHRKLAALIFRDLAAHVISFSLIDFLNARLILLRLFVFGY